MKSCIVKIKFKNNIPGSSNISNICNKLSAPSIYKQFSMSNFDLCNFAVSDALPYDADQLFVPKPAIITDELKKLNITDQKALRTIHYIELDQIQQYLSGTYDYLRASKRTFGSFFRQGRTFFRVDKNAGVYFIASFERHNQIENFVDFIKEYILLSITVECEVVICETPSILSVLLDKKTTMRLTLATLPSNVSKSILCEICDNASYIIFEKSTDEGYKICYIKAGAVISSKSIDQYNQIHNCCISIGYLEV